MEKFQTGQFWTEKFSAKASIYQYRQISSRISLAGVTMKS